MTFDLVLWKWNEAIKKRPSPGLVYLMIEERSVRALARLDSERYSAEIARAFPDPPFELQMASKFIQLGFPHGSLAVDWFLDFSRREGLFVFDPQEPGAVTDEDEAALEALRNKGSPSNARFLEQQAEAGDASAMNELGVLRSFGDGVKADPVEAARWFELAAARGNLAAQRNLADCHREGAGVAHDPGKAISLMCAIIERDPCQPAFELAEWFANGSGIPRDLEKAMQYFRLAREHGHPSAAECIRDLTVTLGGREWPLVGRTDHPVVIRTDYSSPEAWSHLKATVEEPVGSERFRAAVTWVDEREFEGLRIEDVHKAVTEHYTHPFLALADRRSMTSPGHSLQVIEWPGASREFRAAAAAMQSIENNLSISNMDFDDFLAAAAEAPGRTFRGGT